MLLSPLFFALLSSPSSSIARSPSGYASSAFPKQSLNADLACVMDCGTDWIAYQYFMDVAEISSEASPLLTLLLWWLVSLLQDFIGLVYFWEYTLFIFYYYTTYHIVMFSELSVQIKMMQKFQEWQTNGQITNRCTLEPQYTKLCSVGWHNMPHLDTSQPQCKYKYRIRLQQNSMRQAHQILLIIHTLIITCVSFTNLVPDSSFEVYSSNLSQYDSWDSYPFYFEYHSAPASGWWSPNSAVILFRSESQPLPSNTVMDTLANNTRNKICRNFTQMPTNMPYEFNFSYKIDSNVRRPLLAVYWNNDQLLYRYIRNNVMATDTYTVFSSASSDTNTLCFEAWAEVETAFFGPLIDDIVLIKQDVRYVGFTGVVSRDQVNTVVLVSNETVVGESELSIFQQLTLVIAGADYEICNIYSDTNSNLCIELKVYSQYASSQAQPVITLPQHRNSIGQLIYYANVTSTTLPSIIYCPPLDEQILAQSQFYVQYVAKGYAVVSRLCRIVSFGFVGLGWVYGYEIAMLFGFLDVRYLSISSRNAIKSLIGTGVDVWGVGYLMRLAGYQPYRYGAEQVKIAQQLPEPHAYSIEYNTGGLTMNLYSLIVDNLAISIFNMIKVLVFYYVMFRSQPLLRRLFRPIKDNKIIVDFIVILPPVMLVIAITWIAGVPIVNFWGAFNRGCGVAVAGTALWLAVTVFLGDFKRYSSKKRLIIRKFNKIMGETNQKLSKYYSSTIFVDLFQTLAIVIIPLLVGLGFTYSTFVLYLVLTLCSLIGSIKILKSHPNFLTFFRLFAKLLQLYLPVSYLIAHVVSLIPMQSVQTSTEISLMTVLRYNSLILPFLYLAIGFIEAACVILVVGKGMLRLDPICGKAKYDNKVDDQLQTQIKIDQNIQGVNRKQQECISDDSGIRVINQLRDRVQKSSSGTIKSKPEISNPFINSVQTIQSKEIDVPQKQASHSKKASNASKCSIKDQQSPISTPPIINIKLDDKYGKKEKRMTKVITMKNIQLHTCHQQLAVQSNFYERAKSKSSTYLDQHVEQKQNTSIIIKKAKQVGPLALKRKTIKLIQKLEVPKPNEKGEFQLKSQNQNDLKDKEGAEHFKRIKASNFQKQQNFS